MVCLRLLLNLRANQIKHQYFNQRHAAKKKKAKKQDQKVQKVQAVQEAQKGSKVEAQKDQKVQEVLKIQTIVPQAKIELPKAKKYKKKTIDQIQRIEKSKHQRIYLLKAIKEDENEWCFQVEGTTGSIYHVYISTDLKCTCMDFRMKQKPCKHIYFIITQVAQNEELLDYLKNSTTISKNAYDILNAKLEERLKSRLEKKPIVKQKVDIDLKDDTDCAICFCQMSIETEDLDDCQTCKKFFHFECIKVWKRRNPTCPLCRSDFIVEKPKILGDGQVEDRLGKLSQIVL